MRSRHVLHAVDSHTEGMPTRVITGGVGVIPGATMAERRTYFLEHLDDLRTLLMYEPRGHAAMSRRDPAAADPAGRRLRRAVHRGLRLPADVRARHDRRGHRAGRDRHGPGDDAGDHHPARHAGRPGRRRGGGPRRRGGDRGDHPQRAVVPGRAGRRRSRSPGLGEVGYDLAFGGNFYAIVALEKLGLPFERSAGPRLLEAGLSIMDAINAADRPVHPLDPTINGCHHVVPGRPRVGRPPLAARHGHPPRLVRPVAVRHRHVGPDGPAVGPRRARPGRGLRQRVLHRPALRRPAGRGDDGRRTSRRWCRPSPDGPGSPAPPSTCSTPRTPSRPASSSDPSPLRRRS